MLKLPELFRAESGGNLLIHGLSSFLPCRVVLRLSWHISVNYKEVTTFGTRVIMLPPPPPPLWKTFLYRKLFWCGIWRRSNLPLLLPIRHKTLFTSASVFVQFFFFILQDSWKPLCHLQRCIVHLLTYNSMYWNDLKFVEILIIFTISPLSPKASNLDRSVLGTHGH